MKLMLLVVLVMAIAPHANSQEMTDVQRAAKIFAASLPADMADSLQVNLAATGISESEAKSSVAQAIDDCSMCAINSMLDQGRTQGISEDAVLNGMADQPLTAVQEMELNRFDWESWLKRLATCRKTMGSDLGLEIVSAFEGAQ